MDDIPQYVALCADHYIIGSLLIILYYLIRESCKIVEQKLKEIGILLSEDLANVSHDQGTTGISSLNLDLDIEPVSDECNK